MFLQSGKNIITWDWAWCHMPVIPAVREVEMGGLRIENSPKEKK
jgi:hypothetical protein